MVGSSGVVKDHHNDASMQGIQIPKNGYIYIYCSNESPVDVFFDNVQVVHTRGPILEETHYYPFGLTMAGISSQAAGKLENLRKFNKGSELQHKEFSDGSGLELYATNFRSLDPQLGRWWQIDPKSNFDESPYAAMGNNPILHNDPQPHRSLSNIKISPRRMA
ncbi:RHS repeat domain-containing protein [Hydrotalea lipotrueae]|uniref:RHS repeat domain-containing protein n=1 Tax=Hydrotalea lipotrueae TaxID=2803817 RepID=UPI001C48B3B6|nr:RHS repeat-associated core domain-containing protein [Hydrotalea lipotrueae]